MQSRLWMQGIGKWLAVLALCGAGFSMAASEPTLQQVHDTAQAGKLDDAQLMIQQVLITHPQSAKAFFVQAELYARQGKTERASESLAYAEKFAPGLPFAKPQAVEALRAQLARTATVPPSRQTPSGNYGATPAASSMSSTSSSPWALPLLLAAGAIAGAYFLFRKKAPQATRVQPMYAESSGLNSPQTFGMGGGTMQPAYPQGPGYAPQYSPQAGGSGLGGRIMGGVATGLAVGAGVMAAEAIGRNLMGNHNANPPDSTPRNDAPAAPNNYDMGGADMGLNDTSSWDDGASSDASGGSSDWDN